MDRRINMNHEDLLKYMYSKHIYKNSKGLVSLEKVWDFEYSSLF